MYLLYKEVFGCRELFLRAAIKKKLPAQTSLEFKVVPDNRFWRGNSLPHGDIRSREVFKKAIGIINKWQENFSDEKRVKITCVNDGIEVKCPKWWKTYYRLGWLTLAIRIATNVEKLDRALLKQKFNDFIDGKFNTNGIQMDGYRNWRATFV